MRIDRLPARLKALARSPRSSLICILLLALIPRLFLLPVVGHYSDLSRHYDAAQYIIANGLFKMYDSPIKINHPPIGVGLYAGSIWVWHTLTGNDISATFDLDNGGQAAALKYACLLFDLALIALIFEIMLREANVGWAALASLLFAFSPGHLQAVNGMGQTDSIYAFFMALALFLLKRRRLRWAWAVYAVAWLSKFQSIMILPVMIVWTWRRSGPRAVILNLLLFATIISAVMLPFAIHSGQAALAAYRQGAVNNHPYITSGSYNLWYWISDATTEIRARDSAALLWNVSYFQAGLLLFSLVTGLICLRAWLLTERDDEYLVAGVAGVAFFMLLTQIHSRYLYAGLVFLTLALRQAPYLFPIYIGFTLNFGQNVLDTMARGGGHVSAMPGWIFWDDTLNAIANTVFFVLLLTGALWPLWTVRGEAIQRMRASLRLNDFAGAGALLAFALLIFMGNSLIPSEPELTDTRILLRQWIASSVPPDGLVLTLESGLLAAENDDRFLAADVVATSPGEWAANGVAYLAITPRNISAIPALETYIEDLFLVKRITAENPIGPKEIAFYRMLPPGMATDLVFGDRIRLVGYDLTLEPGGSIVFRPYWLPAGKSGEDYLLFVHLYPLNQDAIIVQADRSPAYGDRPTSIWADPDEVLIGNDMILTPPDDLAPGTYRLAVGLYNWRTGERLTLDGGDHYLNITISLE